MITNHIYGPNWSIIMIVKPRNVYCLSFSIVYSFIVFACMFENSNILNMFMSSPACQGWFYSLYCAFWVWYMLWLSLDACQRSLETCLCPIMCWTIDECPRASVMLVIDYEPLFYATKILEPSYSSSYRPHCVLWVYHVPCRDD